MCNLYSMTTNVQAIRDFVRTSREFQLHQNFGNFPPMPAIFPISLPPSCETQMPAAMVRWGMPSSSKALFEAAIKARGIQAKQGRPLSTDEFNNLVAMEPDCGRLAAYRNGPQRRSGA